MPSEREQLLAGIAALEAQRALLGDAVVDVAVSGLSSQLATVTTTQPAPEQTLKQVTILFLDIVGSTALSQHLDPEDIHAVMDGALARCTDARRAHHGRVLQYAGDNLLAVFGADEAREDDRRTRGARAASRCCGRAARSARRCGASTGMPASTCASASIPAPCCSAAVSTPRTAPRHCRQHRRPHGADRARRRPAHQPRHLSPGARRFDVEPQPPLAGQGRRRARRHLSRAARQAARVSGFDTRGIEGLETPMVGREHELAPAAARLPRHAVRQDDARWLASSPWSADAGIGKSRLLYEFQNWAEARPEGFLILLGRAPAHAQSQPYGLLRDMLAWRLQISDSDSRPRWRATSSSKAWRRCSTDDGESQAHVLGHLIGLDFSASPHVRGILHDARQIRAARLPRGSAVAAAVVERAALPVVLMLDDLHWADDGSLDFVEHLFQANRDLPMLVLGLTRPELFERRPDWADAAQGTIGSTCSRWTSPRATNWPPRCCSASKTRPCCARSSLAAQKATRSTWKNCSGCWSTRARSWPIGSPGAWCPTSCCRPRCRPRSPACLQARLDGLPAPRRRALQQASVIGVVFWDQALHVLRVDAPTPENLLAAAPDHRGTGIDWHGVG